MDKFLNFITSILNGKNNCEKIGFIFLKKTQHSEPIFFGLDDYVFSSSLCNIQIDRKIIDSVLSLAENKNLDLIFCHTHPIKELYSKELGVFDDVAFSDIDMKFNDWVKQRYFENNYHFDLYSMVTNGRTYSAIYLDSGEWRFKKVSFMTDYKVKESKSYISYSRDKNRHRFVKENLHIIKNEKNNLLYDVIGSNIYNISDNIANKISEIQNGKISVNDAMILNQILKLEENRLWNTNKFYVSGKLDKLTIIVTSKCNMRCVYCYADYGNFDNYETYEFTIDDIKSYLDKLILFGINQIFEISFLGGEPLSEISLIDFICKYIQHLYQSNKLISLPTFSLVSNLTMVSPFAIDTIKQNNIKVTVSIDGPKEINDKQRIFANGKGSYDIIKKNMELVRNNIIAVEATYTMNHIHSGIKISNLRKFLSEDFNLPIESIYVVPVSDCPVLEVDAEKYDTFLSDNIVDLESFRNINLINKKKVLDFFCEMGNNTLCIMPNGDLYCCHLCAQNRKLRLGNIKEIDNVVNLQNNIEIFTKTIKKDYYKCKKCWARNICHFCVVPYLLSGEKMISDSLCDNRRIFFEKCIVEYCGRNDVQNS